MSLYAIKNSVWTMVFTLFLFCALFQTAWANESIESFTVTIDVTDQGQLHITEEISYDFSNQDRHGIYRTIPLNQVPDDASVFYKERVIDVSLDSVQRNGISEPYTLESSRNEFSLRIGDSGITHTGIHTYTIQYRVSGAIVDFTDGPQGIYWNAIGTEWGVPIQNAHVTLTAAEGILLDSVSQCYVGSLGSQQKCISASVSDNADAIRYAVATTLQPTQAVTIMQAVDANQVAVLKTEQIKLWLVLLSVVGICIVGVLLIIYRFRTKYKISQPELVQYEPYQDAKPMYAGVLIDGTVHSRDITAGIVYLAQQGYIKIKKLDTKVLWVFSGTDYEIIKQKDINYSEFPFLHSVFALLFPADELTTKLSELKQDTAKQKANYLRITNLKKDLHKELVHANFYEKPLQQYLNITAIVVAVGIVLIYIAFFLEWTSSSYVVACSILPVLYVALFIGFSRRRTANGYKAQNHLRGFRTYLSMTEKERYAFHNDPVKNPEKFMEYLPYAIAFGVEDKWAQVFEHVTVPQPDWYVGDSMAHFNAVAFTSSLDSFSSAFAKSTGSVGSSGGSAGGGAGGGGGGSW